MITLLDPAQIKQQRSQTKRWEGPHTLAADHHLVTVLQQRALDKFKSCSLTSLRWMVKDKLKAAGHWRDEVQIEEFVDGGAVGGRCSRLLHGIPSPRFWRVSSLSKGMPVLMPAIDIVYFFLTDANERHDLLLSVTPEFNDLHVLSDWLTTFSSRTFQPDLIQALCDFAAYQISQCSREYQGRWYSPPQQFYCAEVVKIAAEIDRYAWYRGYRSVNLAKAAPVWRLN